MSSSQPPFAEVMKHKDYVQLGHYPSLLAGCQKYKGQTSYSIETIRQSLQSNTFVAKELKQLLGMIVLKQ